MTTRRVLEPDLVEEFRRRLLGDRARLLQTVATTDEELSTLTAPEPGAPVEDAARETWLTLLARLGDREQHELEELQAALRRLGTATFGVCEGCGGSLSLARLRALPTATRCLRCQTMRERGLA